MDLEYQPGHDGFFWVFFSRVFLWGRGVYIGVVTNRIYRCACGRDPPLTSSLAQVHNNLLPAYEEDKHLPQITEIIPMRTRVACTSIRL